MGIKGKMVSNVTEGIKSITRFEDSPGQRVWGNYGMVYRPYCVLEVGAEFQGNDGQRVIGAKAVKLVVSKSNRRFNVYEGLKMLWREKGNTCVVADSGSSSGV